MKVSLAALTAGLPGADPWYSPYSSSNWPQWGFEWPLMNLWTDSSYVKREADAEADAKADAEADAEAEADADRFYGAYLYPGNRE